VNTTNSIVVKYKIRNAKLAPPPKKNNNQSGTHQFRPQYLGPTPKIKFWLPILLAQSWGSQKGMSHLCSIFWRNRLCPRGWLIWEPYLKITCMELDLSWKFHQDPFFPSKVIELYLEDTHTHTHTAFRPYSDRQIKKSLFYTFYFTKFTSITQFVKDNVLSYQSW